MITFYLHHICREPPRDVSTIGDAIKALKSSVMVKAEPVLLEIRRSHVLKDALKEARKRKFQPNKPVKVRKFLYEAIFVIHGLSCFSSALLVREQLTMVGRGGNSFACWLQKLVTHSSLEHQRKSFLHQMYLLSRYSGIVIVHFTVT